MCSISATADPRDAASALWGEPELLNSIPGGTKYDYSGDLYANPGGDYVGSNRRHFLWTGNRVTVKQDQSHLYHSSLADAKTFTNAFGYEEPEFLSDFDMEHLPGDQRSAMRASLGNFVGLGEYSDRFFGNQDWRAKYNTAYESLLTDLGHGRPIGSNARDFAFLDLEAMKAAGFTDPYGLSVLESRLDIGNQLLNAQKSYNDAVSGEAIAAGAAFVSIVGAGLSLGSLAGSLGSGSAAASEAVAANAGGLGFQATASAQAAFGSGIHLANAGTLGAATGGLGFQLTPAAIAAFDSTLGLASLGSETVLNPGGQGFKLTDSAVDAFNSGINLPNLIDQPQGRSTFDTVKDGIKAGFDTYQAVQAVQAAISAAGAVKAFDTSTSGSEGEGRSFQTRPGEEPGVRGKRKQQLAGLNINLGYGDAGPSLVVPEKARF